MADKSIPVEEGRAASSTLRPEIFERSISTAGVEVIAGVCHDDGSRFGAEPFCLSWGC